MQPDFPLKHFPCLGKGFAARLGILRTETQTAPEKVFTGNLVFLATYRNEAILLAWHDSLLQCCEILKRLSPKP
jgi:hypothetical protein